MIGIALLIFGYGIYELVISGLDPILEGGAGQHTNILLVNSFQRVEEQPLERDCGPDCRSVQEEHWL